MNNNITTNNNKKRGKTPDTLCWTCKFCTGATLPNPRAEGYNAANTTGEQPKEPPYFTCPWAHNHKPVAGWTATKTDLKISPKLTTTSYIVEKCPYYKADLEAQINALTADQISKRLEVSVTFVKEHRKISKQLLYTYTKEYNHLVKQHYASTGEKVLPAKVRYKLKMSIAEDMLLYAKEILKEYEEMIDSSEEEQEHAIQTKQEIKGCMAFIKNITFHYKRQIRGAL